MRRQRRSKIGKSHNCQVPSVDVRKLKCIRVELPGGGRARESTHVHVVSFKSITGLLMVQTRGRGPYGHYINPIYSFYKDKYYRLLCFQSDLVKHSRVASYK